MKKIVHRAEDRGGADHGWLKTRHSFSFADWHDPERMGFGTLRVLNDDVIAPRKGFGMHRHENMEIITIVTSGTVTHEDSMGNRGKTKAGEVQAMSAGTGIRHAEMNEEDEPLALFQIWIEPESQDIPPRYDQKEFTFTENVLTPVVSNGSIPNTLAIHVDAEVLLGEFVPGKTYGYDRLYGTTGSSRGAYLFVVDGDIESFGEKLSPGDAIGVWEADHISFKAITKASILLIIVPMKK